MPHKCTWTITFNDGTVVTVMASSKRMAKAGASIRAQRLASEIENYAKSEGKPRNGNKAWRPDRTRSTPKRSPYDARPWERKPPGSLIDWVV